MFISLCVYRHVNGVHKARSLAFHVALFELEVSECIILEAKYTIDPRMDFDFSVDKAFFFSLK